MQLFTDRKDALMESSKNDKNWSRKAGWVALAATTLLTAFFCFWRLGADTILGFDEGRHVAMLLFGSSKLLLFCSMARKGDANSFFNFCVTLLQCRFYSGRYCAIKGMD